jgi:integrase
MPRQVRDSSLETRTARSRLKARHKPYLRLIEPGVHLGYRKLSSGPGTWVIRRYHGRDANGIGVYTVKNLRTPDGRLVLADDYSESDGQTVLSFGQAQATALAGRSSSGSESRGPYTVRRAVEAYLEAKEAEGRDVVDARWRVEAHVHPMLGDKQCAELTTEQIRKWHRGLVKTPPRLRTKPGQNQQYRAFGDDKDSERRRQASANRVFTILKAALNHAFHDGKVPSDIAWRKVKPFKGVDTARLRYLTVDEAKRLLDACDSNFRPLAQAALQTGARYGQLAQLVVADFNPDVGTLRVRTRKGDGNEKEYYITLTDEGSEFFELMCAGRTGDELIFLNNGRDWRKSEQTRPTAQAIGRAKIKPVIGFHGLRHTWASLAVMAGMPLLVVAKNLGHSDTRMVEKHYGHLAPSYVAETTRQYAPRFGTTKPSNVKPLKTKATAHG